MLQGSIVALITPMKEDGNIDRQAVIQLIEWHIQSGTNAISIAGTTGESSTLSHKEHTQLLKLALEVSQGRIHIMAGAGSSNTKEAISLTQEAQQLGADSVLSIVPYYNKPSQEGVFAHFKAIAQSSDIPIILYNVPGRTVVDLNNDTVLRLAELKNIVGLKDATGHIARACDLLKRVPKDFALYSGDDPSSLAFMLCGGHGVVSVCANIFPQLFAKMCQAALNKDVQKAKELNEQLQVVYPILFYEPSPAVPKWILYKMKKCGLQTRLPIMQLSPSTQKVVEKVLEPFHLF